MILTTIRIAAAGVGLAIFYLTLGPVGVRSMSPVAVSTDRALAYAVIGTLAVLSAPRRPWLAPLLVLLMAVGLEAAQRLVLDRHGRFVDLAEKLLGASIGIAVGYAVLLLLRWGFSRGSLTEQPPADRS